MKRAILLATAALLAMLILVPMASAQYDTVINGTTFMFAGGRGGTTIFEGTALAAGGGGGNGSPAPLPSTAGPGFLLPVASLLLGSGILTYAVLGRR